MSLNWNLSRMRNRDIATDADDKLSPRTEAMIWATMAVGIGRITERNAEEFARRIALFETAHGALRSNADGPIYITLDEVRLHIGLSTNVADTSRAAWDKRFARGLLENCESRTRARQQRERDADRRKVGLAY